MKLIHDAILNKQLKAMRELRELSKGDVAEDVGVSKDTYNRWENGRTLPQPYYQQRLCELFETNAQELGFVQEPKKRLTVSTQPSTANKGILNTKLRYMRHFWGWKRQFVAKQIGVSTLTYSRWERGEERPYPYYQQRLCELFETNTQELGFVQEPEKTAITSQLLSANTPNTKLRYMREFRGWSQQDVAKQIGVYTVKVSRWERGEAYPSLHYQKELCKLFEASNEELGLR